MKRTNVFRTLASTGAAVVLLAGMTACGGSPDDASSDDFCGAVEKIGEAGMDFDKTKDAVEELGDIGTPENIDDDAREGFELTIDAYEDADNEDDLKDASDDMSDDDKDKGEAWSKYIMEECSDLGAGSSDEPGDTSSDQPSGMPSDMPTEMPSDLPSELSDLPSEIPTDLGTDLPSELQSMLEDLPSEMPSN